MKFLPTANALSVLLLSSQAFAAPTPAPAPGFSVAPRATDPFKVNSRLSKSGWKAANTDVCYPATYLSTYASTEGEIDGEPWYIAGIWNPIDISTTKEVKVFPDQTGEEIDDMIKNSTKSNFRPTLIKGFNSEGKRKYTSIWVQDVPGAPKVEWQPAVWLDKNMFQSYFDNLVKEGYKLTYVTGSEQSGQTIFSGVFERTPGKKHNPWQARTGLTAANYQKVFDEMVGNGMRLTQVEGYYVKGVEYFAAIWEKSEKTTAWIARHGLTEAKYNALGKAWIEQGYEPTVVSVYGDGVSATAKYAGIWEKPN